MIDPEGVDRQLGPPPEMRSRQSVAESDQRSEYSSMSHHSSYDMSRQVMSAINLTHEMAEIKEKFAQSAAIRADPRQREKEAEEEMAHSHLRLNNLEITLRNMQRDTERRLKRACSHSEHETEPAVDKQQQERRDKRRMPPPPNPLGTTGNIDYALRTEKERYAPYHFRSARAEPEHGEGHNALPRSIYHQK
jgi:cell division protein ZapA (FtsZ GTPase activity inhibitor)